jgi:hypothetical protein
MKIGLAFVMIEAIIIPMSQSNNKQFTNPIRILGAQAAEQFWLGYYFIVDS